jgi:hypothetical protein
LAADSSSFGNFRKSFSHAATAIEKFFASTMKRVSFYPYFPIPHISEQKFYIRLRYFCSKIFNKLLRAFRRGKSLSYRAGSYTREYNYGEIICRGDSRKGSRLPRRAAGGARPRSRRHSEPVHT